MVGLLAVIATVTSGAALPLPALNGAKEETRQTCLSNDPGGETGEWS